MVDRPMGPSHIRLTILSTLQLRGIPKNCDSSSTHSTLLHHSDQYKCE